MVNNLVPFIIYIFVCFCHTVSAKNANDLIMQYDGKLVPYESMEIISPYHATIHKKHVNYGDQVTAGQLLFELTSAELTEKLAQANIELIEATFQFEKQKNWLQSHEVLQAKSNVNRALQYTHHQEARYLQTQKLVEAGVVSTEEYLLDKRSYEESRQQVENAKRYYIEVKKNGDKTHLALAKLRYDQAKSQVESLTRKNTSLKVLAPINGVVLAPTTPTKSEGSILSNKKALREGESIIQIASQERFTVRIKVDEYDIIHLKKEQKAEITLPALGGEKLKGKILSLYSQSEVKEPHHAAQFEVNILLDEVPQNLKEKILLGMSAIVNLG